MSEQQDFLRQAFEALRDGEQAFSDAATEIHAPEYYLENSLHSLQVSQLLSLLSLAQDVRRVADALEAMQSTSALRVDLLS